MWQAWEHLGQMSREEAMRLFVRQLEYDVPSWWTDYIAYGLNQPKPSGNTNGGSPAKVSLRTLPPRQSVKSTRSKRAQASV